MDENKTNLPDDELDDEALENVAGGSGKNFMNPNRDPRIQEIFRRADEECSRTPGA